jgi:hypothetical protein
MKIMLVGAENENSIETYYAKHLSKYSKDNEVIFFKAKNIFNEYYYKSILNAVLFRMGISGVLFRINKQLKKIVIEKNPDVVIIFKGMEIFPKTISWIKSKSIKTINYNTDNPFYFTGKGSGNMNIQKSLGLYDLLLTYDSSILKKLKQIYHIPSQLLPFGYDQINDKNIGPSEEILKVCFIGNADPYRLSFLNRIANGGIEIDLYGEWDEKKLHKNIHFAGKLPRNKLSTTIQKYRIQLNILRKHNERSHNMRTFEIPSNGGIQLAPATDDHTLFFTENEEIFIYEDNQDCINKISYLMSMPFNEANEIRMLAKKRCVGSGYSYENRTAMLYNYLKNDI